jgi:hypothetical protein
MQFQGNNTSFRYRKMSPVLGSARMVAYLEFDLKKLVYVSHAIRISVSESYRGQDCLEQKPETLL